MDTDSADRARTILDAWQRKDLNSLRAQLSLPSSVTAGDAEEQERMDLLDGIAQQMRQNLPEDPSEVCFRLLEHLAVSGNHPAIRSLKLAFFRC